MSEIYVSHDGEPPLVELEALPVYDSIRGQQVQRRWIGSTARIRAQYEAVLVSGAQTVRISEGPGGMGLQLTADFAGVINSSTGEIDTTRSVVVTDWTSEPAVFSKSLWDFPPVAAELNKLGLDDAGISSARLIRTYIDAFVRGDSTIPDPADPTNVKTIHVTLAALRQGITDAGLSLPVFDAFVADLIRGRTSFGPASWTLRRSRRIPAVSTFRETATNVGRMLAFGALAGEGFTPELIRTQIPTTGYWLKHPPTDRPVGDGFREVTTDFEWAEQYSTFIYGLPVFA